jgi:hypothetical protein
VHKIRAVLVRDETEIARSGRVSESLARNFDGREKECRYLVNRPKRATRWLLTRGLLRLLLEKEDTTNGKVDRKGRCYAAIYSIYKLIDSHQRHLEALLDKAPGRRIAREVSTRAHAYVRSEFLAPMRDFVTECLGTLKMPLISNWKSAAVPMWSFGDAP